MLSMLKSASLAKQLSCAAIASVRHVTLQASPQVCLHDVETKITASELQPNFPYSLRAETTDEKNRRFISCGHFMSDEQGNIDLTKDESYGGSYKGVLPMGLLVGLVPGPEVKMFPRLCRQDVFLPWQIKISLHESHISAELPTSALSEVTLERHIVTPGVKRIPIREGRVRGVLYIPEGEGPFPGVLDIYGLNGGIDEFRSAALSSRGIASLALPYFDYDDLPKEVDKFELDYFEEATEILCSFKEIIPDRCGIWSSCFSGQFAVLLGQLVEKVKAVAILNGMLIPCECTISYKGKQVTTSPHHINGDSVEFDSNNFCRIKYSEFKEVYDKANNRIIVFDDFNESTQYLLLSGSQCGMFNYLGGKAFEEIIKERGFNNVERIMYPGCSHILDPPYSSVLTYLYQPVWPHKPDYIKTPYRGIMLYYGGEVEGTYKAQQDMWPRIRNFINSNVRDRSEWYQSYLTRQNATSSS